MYKSGLKVSNKYFEDGDSVREQFDVPSSLQSCHITVIADYFVEGHVPIEVLGKLMTESPDIDGLAMEGMPDGSPGMPGRQREDWVIYTINDGQAAEYVTKEK